MKLHIDPAPNLVLLSDSLEIVLEVKDDSFPEIYLQEGLSRPDRHFLLSMVQILAVAIEEKDAECVEFAESRSIRLERENETIDVDTRLLMVRTEKGRTGALAMGDPRNARRTARNAVRYLTGTIRLDVP